MSFFDSLAMMRYDLTCVQAKINVSEYYEFLIKSKKSPGTLFTAHSPPDLN